MRKGLILFSLLITIAALVSFTSNDADNLRKIYSQSPDKWPKPFIDPGVEWKELGMLPASPIAKQQDSLKHLIELGKVLFFDTRLSGSSKISCASCHQPELNWADGKEKAILGYTLARADAFVAYNKLLQTAGVLATDLKK